MASAAKRSINLHEGDYFDIPPINLAPATPTTIEIPLRQVEGGSSIGTIIAELFTALEPLIQQQYGLIITEGETIVPIRVKWQQPFADRPETFSISVESTSQAPTPGSTLPPTPEPSLQGFRFKSVRGLFICLGGISTGILVFVVLCLELIFKFSR